MGYCGVKGLIFDVNYQQVGKMSFIGQISAKLDAKNRVFLPAAFRRILQDARVERLVVRKDFFENCLVIYPEDQWKAEVEKVRSRLNRFDSRQQMVYRKMVSEAQEVQLDSSGRMLVAKALLEKVGIDQEVLFVGMENTIEMWAPQAAETLQGQPFMTDEDFAEGIKEFMTE